VNAAQFNQIVNQSNKDIPTLMSELQRKVALEALRRLVFRTRVRTGRARNNWQVGIGARPKEVLHPAKQKFNGDKSGRAAYARCASGISKLPPFGVCHITNNVEYILYLEDLDGMLAVTVNDIRAMFR